MFMYSTSISPEAQRSKLLFDVYTENQTKNVLTALMGLT